MQNTATNLYSGKFSWISRSRTSDKLLENTLKWFPDFPERSRIHTLGQVINLNPHF
jgi:hypothetical protein